MKKENKKKILIIVACVLAVLGVLCGIYFPNEPINNTIGTYQNTVIEELKAIDENVVIEDITENEELSSTADEVVATIQDEKMLETEAVEKEETEGFELQGDISYDGDRAKSWNIELGDYSGLTYFSQLDRKMEKQFIYICRK